MKALKRYWCRLAHSHTDVMYPDGGTYQCRRCLERFEVPWVDAPVLDPRPRPQMSTERVLADGRWL